MLAGLPGLFSQERSRCLLPSAFHIYVQKKKYIWSLQALRSWPHYAVLVDEGDETGSHLTYVVQEQLELMKNTEVSVM
jgi:hypothetical protein